MTRSFHLQAKGQKTNYYETDLMTTYLFSQMYKKVNDQNLLTVENVKKVLQDQFPKADVGDILGIHSVYDNERKVS